jgi:predicted AlkP superfamily pyrophosphatase or phosphodiesterase
MLNTASLNAVDHATFSQQFVRPLYDSYCFANIPLSIQFLLTGEGTPALPLDVFGNLPTRYDKVILFFVDAFGWRFFERYAEHYPFLKTFLDHGVVSKLTSQFPSTTAAHSSCIHTGLNVGQSGVYEWNYYEPLVDDIISPLLFSYADDKFARDTLSKTNIPSAKFYPQQSLYQTLKAKGVVSYIFQSQAYTPSTFSNAVFQGGHVVPFQSLSEALARLTDIVTAHKAPPYYYFFYFDRIDAICHHYGPNSPQFEREVESFLTAMEQIFIQKLRGKIDNTLLLVTADHGQVEVDPNTTIYLNKIIPGIERYLKTNQQGKLLVPAGSARDMFLHVKEELLAEAVEFLQKYLVGRAEVYPTTDLLAQHFFGTQPPSTAFLNRVGNVVILPYANETVWWYQEGVHEMRFHGHHGGLTRAEMEIPLMALSM